MRLFKAGIFTLSQPAWLCDGEAASVTSNSVTLHYPLLSGLESFGLFWSIGVLVYLFSVP